VARDRVLSEFSSSENRESTYRGFRGHETFAIRNREVRNPETMRDDKDRPSFRTRVRTWERVGNRGIGVFGHTKIMSHGITICDYPMRSGPFVLRTCGNDRSHREIVNPVDEVSMLNEIAKRDFPISQEIAGPTEG
jgi:hypothetical protein